MLRHQLPVYSPVSLVGLTAGLLPSASVASDLRARIMAEYGAQEVVLTASGTVALALSYRAAAPAGIRPRVALPAWACPDLMSAADAVDAEVVLYDIDPHTLAPDLDSLRGVLAGGPHALVVAHWFGLPVDLGELRSLAMATETQLIDDAAQAVGASVGGRLAGAMGDFGILSFGRGKGRTGGGGGAVLAGGEAAAHRLRDVASRLGPANSGLGGLAGLLGQWGLGRPGLYWIPAALPGLHLGETVYHSAPALRAMAARNAAAVSAIWSDSAEAVPARRTMAARWTMELTGRRGLTTYQVPAGALGGWLRFPVYAQETASGVLSTPGARRLGIAPGYPKGLWELPLARGRILRGSSFSGSKSLSRFLFTLPTHGLVSRADCFRILTHVQSL